MDRFYQHLLQFDALQPLLADEATVQRLKGFQRDYLVSLASGNYDGQYAEDRLRIGRVHEKIGSPKKVSAEIVELVFDTLKESLERGEKIKISGFGNFDVRNKKERTGRNPQTGEEIQISASNNVGFKPGKALKGALN